MKEKAIQSINKIGKVSSVFALIGKIVVGLGLVILLACTILCFAIPEELFELGFGGTVDVNMDLESMGLSMTDEEVTQAKKEAESEVEWEEDGEFIPGEMEITNDNIHISGTTTGYTITLRDFGWLMIVLLIDLTMIMITLCFISSLCKAFRDCETPFEQNVIKKMQNFAYSLIPWAVISSITNSITNSFMSNKIAVTLSIDISVIVVVLVVFVLVHIFKYGAVLQQESDETL